MSVPSQVIDRGAAGSRIAQGCWAGFPASSPSPPTRTSARSAARPLMPAHGPIGLTEAELISMNSEVAPFVVDGLLPPGVTLLISAPLVGKSRLAKQLAHAVATGGDFLGRETTPGEVLFVNLEEASHEIASRAGASTTRALRWIPRDVLPQYARNQTERVEVIRSQITPATRLVVIDRLSLWRDMPDPRANAYYSDQAALEPLTELASSHPGLAILVLHHETQGWGKNRASRSSGTHALPGESDNTWLLTRTPKSCKGTLNGGGRYLPETGDIRLTFDTSSGTWSVTEQYVEDKHTAPKSSVASAVRQYVARCKSGSEIELKLVVAAVKAELPDADYDAVRQHLGRLCKPRRGRKLAKSRPGIYAVL